MTACRSSLRRTFGFFFPSGVYTWRRTEGSRKIPALCKCKKVKRQGCQALERLTRTSQNLTKANQMWSCAPRKEKTLTVIWQGDWLAEEQPWQRGLGAGSKINVSQQCVLTAKEANGILGCVNRRRCSRWGEGLSPSTQSSSVHI